MSQVSIILPTFNRAPFLPAAFEAICGQTHANWELIVVDDGSTDETKDIVHSWKDACDRPVHYLFQENQGAYGARNTGLDEATGQYIAFYDSDDIWLPHHLTQCVRGLEANKHVDWVYGACRIVDGKTREVLAPTTFRIDGEPRPFMNLRVRATNGLHVIEDPNATLCMIRHGLYNGLQNSVIRKSLFDDYRFEADSRNEAEDQLFVLESLARNRIIGYYDDIHVDYVVHESNSSAAGSNVEFERQARVLRLLIEGYERILANQNWTFTQRCALRKRLLSEYFWKLGYATYWRAGHRSQALATFRQGLLRWPFDIHCWKTYLWKRITCLSA